ncbi:MAG: hypothetical protein R2759_07165 [Bacteroidales bacterium]
MDLALSIFLKTTLVDIRIKFNGTDIRVQLNFFGFIGMNGQKGKFGRLLQGLV